MKAAIKTYRKISVMQYYPRILWDRKKSLEKRMAIERVKDKKNLGIRSDLVAMISNY